MRNGFGKSGYLKVCSRWVRKFWDPDTNPPSRKKDDVDYSGLSKPTEEFNKCGFYEIDESDTKDGVIEFDDL